MILATYLRPFDAKQKIYVLTGSRRDVEEIRLASLEQYADTVMQLLAEYGISELELHGNDTLCSKMGEEIQRKEMLKYNNNQLKITYKGV